MGSRLDAIDDETKALLRDLQDRQGLSLFDARVQAAMPRKWRLYFRSPSGTPERLPGKVMYMINDPGVLGSTRKWQHFRDDMAARAVAVPEDPNFAAYVAAADELLAWRGKIAPEDEFWREA